MVVTSILLFDTQIVAAFPNLTDKMDAFPVPVASNEGCVKRVKSVMLLGQYKNSQGFHDIVTFIDNVNTAVRGKMRSTDRKIPAV
jgi:hypothetical protein